MNPAVLYRRVSDPEQEEGYSLPAQQELLRDHAAKLGLLVEQEFMDVDTAKTTGRPGFDAMVEYFRTHPACRTLLVEKTDRLYRNFKDYVTIDELDLEIHFVKENFVLTKDSRSSEKFMHGIKVLMAKNYIDNLSEEVKKGLRMKAAQHLWPSFAPLGYSNTGGPDGKRIIVPDPLRGSILRQLLEWFATGEYSMKRLAQKAFDEGFRFRQSNGRIPISTLHKILRNPIYMGDFIYGGVRYHGSHEPLVSPATWERVQEILDGRHKKKHRKVTHDFAYSGLVNCGHCGCSLVGEMKKGRYVYYHCTGYRGKCPEPYTREEVLQQQFASALRDLVVPPAVLQWLQEEIVASDKTERAAREQAKQRNQAELERLQGRLDVLYEDRLDGRIDAGTYDQKAVAIRDQQQQLRQTILSMDTTVLAPTQAVDLVALTSRAVDLYLEQPASEQHKLLHILLEKASWKAGELQISFAEPFERLRLSHQATANDSNNFDGGEGNSGECSDRDTVNLSKSDTMTAPAWSTEESKAVDRGTRVLAFGSDLG